MLGSHNTMSYLPIHGWRKILKPWTKCQSLDIYKQYRLGVRYFDIRLRIINGEWHLCHNKADLGLFKPWQEFILSIAYKPECHFRFILDVRKKPKNAKEYKEKFLSFIDSLQIDKAHPFDSVIVYWEWKNYGMSKVEPYEYHASVMAHWYQYIFGIKAFAKYLSRKLSTNAGEYFIKNENVFLLDYVQYIVENERES